ncbi:hypothetical protein [Labilibaculum euxinus]
MKTHKIAIIILILCLHTNLFADIAPNPIKARSISPKDPTSIRMESEKVIIDLYNDSSVVTCLFNMKNLGEQEKLQIGFPEMKFHYYRNKSKIDESKRFQVKENGRVVKFDFSDSLRYDKEYRKKLESYQIKEEWYLWESEFQQGEAKTIEVQYSLPYGMLYKTNERFFTYLLSTGANWKGTIGKAEITVNLKDIEMDSIISQKPSNCIISNDQLIWTFSDFEPTTKDDIKINYNSSKILYTGKKPIPPVFILDENLDKEFDLKSIEPNVIASIEVIKKPEETKKYTNQNNGVVKIYTKDFVLTELKRLIKAKSKEKIVLPDYDRLKEDYRLFINEDEVDFAKIIGFNTKSVAKLEIIDLKDEQNKIMIELKK